MAHVIDCSAAQPLSAFYSTNLNNAISGYNRLGERISRSLGAPLVNVEIHQDQLYENISIAIEMFTKFAGYTREYLVFSSNLYERGAGIRLDVLFSANRGESLATTEDKKLNPGFNYRYKEKFGKQFAPLYGIGKEIIGQAANPYIFQVGNQLKPDQLELNQSYDYLLDEYRKVLSVRGFEEGSSDGVNTLFTIEQTLAQQTYFSYSMGNYGFDLISWYVLKNWLDTREKMLALRKAINFNERTQYMQMYPEPKEDEEFWGSIECYVEKPIMWVVKEEWVYQYALALSKIVVGRVRGKYGNVQLFGGGVLNYDLLEEGRQEKEELENKLYSGASPGMGDAEPTLFLVG
mgnify:FL=1|tara:strand:- start:4203 stop:5246 length:1044 start_codon:yes stop_codon:yes gene_type:complete